MARILVADDDRTISHLVTTILRKEGHTVMPAFDAMQTVMFAMRVPQPELVVLDIHMPGGTGLEALRKLRASSRTAMLPVIVLSGTASQDERDAVESLGVQGSLHKPVEPDVLIAAVNQVLGV